MKIECSTCGNNCSFKDDKLNCGDGYPACDHIDKKENCLTCFYEHEPSDGYCSDCEGGYLWEPKGGDMEKSCETCLYNKSSNKTAAYSCLTCIEFSGWKSENDVNKSCDNCFYEGEDDGVCDECEYLSMWEPRVGVNGTIVENKSDGMYDVLDRIISEASEQAKTGKGKERHADNEAFEDQKIIIINRWVKGSPAAGNLYQVIKKSAEAARLEPEKAIHELRGVINYAAASIYAYEQEIGVAKK